MFNTLNSSKDFTEGKPVIITGNVYIEKNKHESSARFEKIEVIEINGKIVYSGKTGNQGDFNINLGNRSGDFILKAAGCSKKISISKDELSISKNEPKIEVVLKCIHVTGNES